MPRLATAFVEITANTLKFKRGIAEAKRDTTNFGKQATRVLKGVTIGIGLMGAAAIAAATAIGVKLTRAIIRAGRESVRTAVKYDKLKRGLTAVAGSSAEAERQLIRLQKVAELPGLSFQQAIQGSINLQAAGLSAELSERALKAFGNALVTVGKGAEDLGGVNLALTQIANKTSGFGQDIRQLQERLPQMQVALKNAFDGKPLEDLEITGKELVAALVTEFEKLPRAAGGIANSIENLGVSFDLLKKTVGEALLPIVETNINALTQIIDKIKAIVKVWKLYQDQVAVVFKNVGLIAVRATAAMLRTIARLIRDTAVVMWEPMALAFKLALAKMFDTATVEFGSDIGWIRSFTEKLNNQMRKAFQGLGESIAGGSIKDLETKLNKSTDEAFSGLIDIAERDFTQAASIITSGLQDINSELDALGNQATKLDQFSSAVRETINRWAEFFKSLRDGKVGDEVSTTTADIITKWDGMLNDVAASNKLSERVFIRNQKRIREAAEKTVAERIKMEQSLADFFADIEDQNLAKSQEAAQERLRSIQNSTRGMQGALSDFVASSISDIDNLSDAWNSFIDNMKSAFIRAVAEMAANKAFQAIINAVNQGQPQGGAGVTPDIKSALGAGVGGILGGVLGSLIAPGIGTAIGASIGTGLGGSIAQRVQESNVTNNFFETDFANLDRNRIERTVSQSILPSLDELRANGK